MFERYTEKARRLIFFARYEASQFGSPYIETEHLLLGLLRESKESVTKLLSSATPVEAVKAIALIRSNIESNASHSKVIPTSVDLPLSNASKRALAYAAEEAERFSHQYIGTEHLLLGLMRETDGLASKILAVVGVTLEQARIKVADWSPERDSAFGSSYGNMQATEIHGRRLPSLAIDAMVKKLIQFAWVRRDWKAMDVVVDDVEGGICFDLAVKDDPRYKFVAGGWTKEPCAICGWELTPQGGPERSEAFTNGRQWLCAECYHRFVAKKSAGAA